MAREGVVDGTLPPDAPSPSSFTMVAEHRGRFVWQHDCGHMMENADEENPPAGCSMCDIQDLVRSRKAEPRPLSGRPPLWKRGRR